MAKRKRAPSKVTIAAPMDTTADAAPFRTHLDLHLTREQGTALRQLAAGLDDAKACSNCGPNCRRGPRRVTNPQGAVRWLLEELARQVAAKRPAKAKPKPPAEQPAASQ